MTSTAHRLGVSYRRLDYWARCGYLRPHGEGGGSGTRRQWNEHELRVAALIVRLVDVGMTLPVAAEIARAAVDEGEPTHYAHVGDGVYLVLVVDVTADTARPRARGRRDTTRATPSPRAV